MVEENGESVLMMSHGITGVTGFSNQLLLQARSLIDAGYKVYAIHRDYRGEPIEFPRGCTAKTTSGRPLEGLTMLPIAQHQWAEDIMPYYIMKFKPDYVHTLGDIWCYKAVSKIPKHHDWKWLAHYVFDTENMVSFWNEHVQIPDMSVVPAQFAYKMLLELGHKNVKYVQHGVDTNTYQPATFDEKIEFRKKMGIPENAYVVGMVAHNQTRKMVNRLVTAFDMFSRKNPDAVLLLHCVPRDQTGWDLPQILKDKNLLHKTFFTDKAAKGVGDIQVPESEMRKLYCSMDIHALPTGGEGFGVPVVEAMACGIPNVMTAYTTAKEFLTISEDDREGYINDRGIAVPYIDIDEHNSGGIWAKVDCAKMAAAFQYLKDNQSEAKHMGGKARKFAVENYDNEVVKKKWVELYSTLREFADALDDEKREGTRELRTLRLG